MNFRPWMLRMWLIDHSADWASRAGDRVSRPFARLERWCNRHWFDDYNNRDRREYQQVFYPNEP